MSYSATARSTSELFDPRRLLNRILDSARQFMPYDAGGMAIWDEERQVLLPFLAWLKNAPLQVPESIRLGEGVVGTVAQTHEPMIIGDIRQTHNYLGIYPDILSEIAVPIIHEGRLLGVIDIESQLANAYTQEHLIMLKGLADQAALVLETSTIFHQLSDNYERLQTAHTQTEIRNAISNIATSDLSLEEMLPQMANHLVLLADVDACAINLWDSARQRSLRMAASGIDDDVFFSMNRPPNTPSLTKTIIETRKPVIINDAQALENPPSPLIPETGAKSVLALPLIARGRAIGSVFLMHVQSNTPFTESSIEPLKAPLDQIALTIDSRQLLQETRKNLSDTSALLEIASIAANVIKQDDMLQQAMEAIRTAMEVQAVMVLLFDQRSGYLMPMDVQLGFPEMLQGFSFSADAKKSLFAEVFKTGLPRYLNDLGVLTSNEKAFAEQAHLHNLLVVGLRVQFHPIGVLAVANRAEGFNGADAGFLAAAGSHIAATLRHTELLDATRARLRETEVLQQIASITSSTLDLDEMLQRTLRATAELLQAEGALLILPNPTQDTLVPHVPSAFGTSKQWLDHRWRLDEESHPVDVFKSRQYYLSNEPTTTNIVNRQNILSVPLTTVKDVLGDLILFDRREGQFETSHAELAQAIASHIALNIENTRRFAAEQERARVMATANQISQELSETLDPGGLIRKLTELLHTELGYEMVAVFTKEDNHFVVQAHATDHPELALSHEMHFAEETSLLKLATEKRGAQLIQSDDEAFASLGLPQLRAGIVVAIRREQNINGIVLVGTTQERALRDLDREVLDLLTPQIASVLENARLYQQAQRRLIQQGIVQQIGQDLAATINYAELMQSIARHMTRALDTSSCLVAVYSPRDEMVRIEADYRIGTIDHSAIEPMTIGNLYAIESRPAMQQAIEERGPVVVYRDDERSPLAQRHVLQRLDEYSQMVVPMVVGDRVIGLVDWMERRRPRVFTPEDERLALILVSQAAIAVENARLFRESERRATQQALLRQVAVELGRATEAKELLDYLAGVMVDSLYAENVAIAIRTPDQRFEVISSSANSITEDEFVLNRVHREKDAPQLWKFLMNGYSIMVEPTIVPNNAAAQELHKLVKGYAGTVIMTPINQRGQLLGIMEVMISLNDSMFESYTPQLLESLADQTAIAIDNIFLQQRERRRLRQIEQVQSSGRLISSELYMPDLLSLIVEEAAEVFEVDAVSLDMPDGDNRFYTIRAAHGLTDKFIRRRRTLVEEPKSENVRQPVYTDNLAEQETDPAQQELVTKEKMTGVLNVPLVKAGKVLGYLRLYQKNKQNRQVFNEQDHEIAQLMASQVTIALENANLFSELEQRAQELLEANRLKSAFLATMSHELRTPMNSIIGFSTTLLSGIYGDLTEKQSARIERILRNGRNLLALIDDLLDLSKIEAGKMEISMEAVDIRQEIMAALQAIESQAQNKGIDLEVLIPDEVPAVLVDPLRLRQILNNLLGNALKFTKEGKVAIHVHVKEEPTESGYHTMVHTAVIDSGIGIKPADQEVIFDEFRQADGSTTREFGGTGLGLAICRRLLQLMHGKIWVESELGKGSKFIFTLPTVVK